MTAALTQASAATRQAFRLRGVIAAIPTPVDRHGEPDIDRFLALATDLLAEGCDGLNVLGTTGEATSFTREQRMALMTAIARSSLPLRRLMVGTGAAAIGDALALTRHAAELGFAGALVLPPFYYKGVPEDGLVAFFDALARETAGLPVPLYLYHFPALSGVPYHPALIARLRAAFGARIAGLKDSSGDLDYARAATALSDFDVFPSNEATLAEARSGVFAGCISATANVSAHLCARALHAADDAALHTASAMRKAFEGLPLVPAVKALLAHLRSDPSLATMLPPWVPVTGDGLQRLIAAHGRLDP